MDQSTPFRALSSAHNPHPSEPSEPPLCMSMLHHQHAYLVQVCVCVCVWRVIRKPIIQTDIGFYHEASHADASRKRIMEDTEDWRPRTGTSQSRSFNILAQITGTEGVCVCVRYIYIYRVCVCFYWVCVSLQPCQWTWFQTRTRMQWSKW